jgi:3-hydroxyisobutyrate dehydrogenase
MNDIDIKTVGIVGLGNMGTGMALSLQRAGFRVLGTAASEQTRARASAQGIETLESPRVLARHCDAIVLSLPTPEAVASVVEAQGLKAGGRRGQIVIDTTTSDAPTSRRIAASLQEAGIAFIDAPVSGGPDVARKGQLTMMLGGTAEDVARAEPVLQAIGALRVHVGPLGAGNLAKLANNLMAASHYLVASELMLLVQQAGLDVETFLQVVNASTGRSFITERVYPTWICSNRFDVGFAIKLMRKDVRLATEEIRRMGLALPVAALVAQEWLQSGEWVGDEEDITRIVELPARRAGKQADGAPPSNG